jgi:RimJ/RimL family protein N-acetyltransferase
MVLVRPLDRQDGPALAAAVEHMSEQSRYRRFHTGISHLTEEMTATLTDVDHHDHEALLATPEDSGEIVGVARFVRTPERLDTAELAIGVADSWQRRGLATLLLRQLGERAAQVGIEHFTATILAENAPTIALVKGFTDAEFTRDGPVLSAQMQPADWKTGHSDKRLVLRVPSAPEIMLLPRLLRAMSSGLTRTVSVPVAALLRRRHRGS